MNELLLWNLLEGLFKRKKLHLLRNPELQKSYRMLLEKGRIEDIRHLRNATKTKPSSDNVKHAYKQLLKKGWVGAIENIQKETKIKPIFNKSDINRAYDFFISEGMLNHLKVLKRITGEKPASKIVQTGYKRLIDAGRIDLLKTLQSITKIPNKNIEASFLLAIKNANFDLATSIYKTHKLEINRKFPEAPYLVRKYIMNSS